MADKDNQFVAFHEGQEVDVPEEVKVAKPEVKPAAPIDVPYITRENEPVSAEPNFVLKGDPSLDRPTYTSYESAGQTEKLNKEEHITVVLITHYMNEAVLADKIKELKKEAKKAEKQMKMEMLHVNICSIVTKENIN